MRLYIGIDAGGTKTECAVGNETEVLGRFTAGTCKLQRVGKEAATASLEAAVRGALYASKSHAEDIVHSCIGIAGASQHEVVEFAEATLHRLLPGKVTVLGDHVIAHESAYHGASGVLIIGGTGSIAYGRNESGKTIRAGGNGPIVSDEGSGTWIGRTAVCSALLADDSGTPTALTAKILKAWNATTQEDIVRIGNGYPPPNFAALFPHVLAAAEAGDPLAMNVLDGAGRELAKLALIVIRQLWPEGHPVQIAIAGGVITNSAQIWEVVRKTISAERPTASFKSEAIDPILGALYIARNAIAQPTHAI
jgi:N-acetylglucosamine kinase-like BadF-type ATPase